MIKNSSAWAIGTAAVVALAGCREREPAPSELQGIVEIDERPLGFELPGRVSAVPVRRGQHVKRGQVLASLDDGLEKPQREMRLADLRTARAQLALIKSGARREDVEAAAAQARAVKAVEENAQAAAARIRALHAGGTVPKAQLDDAEKQLARATAERQAAEERYRSVRKGSRVQEIQGAAARVEAAEAAAALSDARIQRLQLHAPIEGVVLEVHVEPGQVVNAGTPVITVGDAGHPYVDLFVPQGELGGVRVGQAALVRVDSEAQPFRGAVEDVARKTEFTPRYLFSPKERPNLVVRVRVRLEDPQHRLHAGVPARARLDRGSFREGT